MYPSLNDRKISIKLEGNFPLVVGNEAGLTQCFANLIANAVKFVKPGIDPVIRLWAKEDEGWVRIYIQDNGIGVLPDHHERIFLIFQRVSNCYEGTGIGLAIVKKAALRMGGDVGIESELGKDSTFWLKLLAAKGESL